jgi:hypothetical protein
VEQVPGITGAASVGRKALIVAAVAWIQLAVLAAVQGYALSDVLGALARRLIMCSTL